jgi:hypothetical protein
VRALAAIAWNVLWFFWVIAPLVSGQQTQEIVTDRPDVTEASTVVPVDSLQIENGFTQTSDRGSGTLDFSESLVRYGLSHRTEFRIGLPNIFLRDVGLPSALGVSDLSFGVKQQLGPLAGSFDVAVIAALSFPTGASNGSTHGLIRT